MTKTSLTSFDVNYWVIPSEMDIRKTEVACTYVYLTCTECTSTSVRNGTCCVHVYAIESVHMYLACTGGIRVGTCRVHGTTPYTCTYRVLYGPTEYKRGTCCVHGFSYRCTAHVPNGRLVHARYMWTRTRSTTWVHGYSTCIMYGVHVYRQCTMCQFDNSP